MSFAAIISGTLAIGVFSWFFSIKHKRYHGIPRFFVFESIFFLILLNLNVWFRDPFSLSQIISWIFLILSAWAGISGYLTLKRKGRPTGNFENTSLLVTTGIYRYIRHPLYLSLFLLGAGIMFKRITATTLLLGLIICIAAYITARIEEREMTEKFGGEYRVYMKESKMFIPFII